MKQSYRILFKELTGKEIRSYFEFKTGFSNINIGINDAHVFRVPKEFKDPTLSYKNEKIVYEAIAKLNISEKLEYLNFENGIKMTKYVHNARIYEDTLEDNQIKAVAKTLKKLHKSEIKVPFGYQMFYKLKIYKAGVDKELYLNKDYEDEIISQAEQIFKKDPLVICHNDLVQGNILFRFNDIKIIDWETGGMNNPYFDVASFISENNLNYEQEENFLKYYFGYKLNNLKRKRVHIFIKFQDVLFYYRALFFYKNRKEKIYKLIAEEKLKRINQVLY